MFATPKTSYFKKNYKQKSPFISGNIDDMMDEMPRMP